MAFVRAIVLGYEKYGIDPSAALRQAQITPSQLRRPDARITAAQMELISGAAMQQLDDEALGWFSRRLPWGSYGMVCRASITAPDLGVALKRWCRHHRLLTDDIVLSLEFRGGTAHYTIAEPRALGAMREFCLVTSLRFVHGFACWAIDSRIPLREASFPFAAPPHHGVYPLLFPGRIVFDAAQAGFSFDAQYLALPLRRDAATLVSAEALADALHVSTRTLHRQLHEEGAALQQLKDEARREQALDQLCRSTRAVKQIARAVGFASEKSFARAFRQWTGESPSEYRRKVGE